jgi:hypothetical protein
MKITEWFDPCVITHVRAYNHLQKSGSWPNGFIPEDITFPQGWQTIIAFKMANEWVKLILDHEG